MSETANEQAKRLRDLAASHSYQEALLAGAEALEYLASRPSRPESGAPAPSVGSEGCRWAPGEAVAAWADVMAQRSSRQETSTPKAAPRVLHEAWSIIGTTGNLAGVQSNTPLLFFATQEEAAEAAKFRPRPFRPVRVQIVEVLS